MSLFERMTQPAQVLVYGASRGIGLALCEQLLARHDVAQVFAVARHATQSPGLAQLSEQQGTRLVRVDNDARNETDLAALATQIGQSTQQLNLVISTLGILQEEPAKAEKGLAQLDMDGLLASFRSNTFAPILLLKHLLPLLRGRHPCCFAALSARVGSIGDNHLGGWYSYRASKAALNQLLRTASIELKRLNPSATILSLHPGTTDTQLSKPFQANVPADKLFTCEFSASRLLELVDRHGPQDTGSFLAWDDTPIPW
ncbi:MULTISPECIES: SDR family NAD(P)-dependent oxidoreductase [unclassified Pseudomonas]|uniref:SDR family NAD(P)-dependent oxidoreductase n=1 Tax=unclassified Pseudomonas TaxID=196821 RepID=UPI002AC9DDB5|nr:MULTISPECIES: SDR family NAD(P)-dependent oxidoreductase [unclassified Pseudomonas]MEB0043898.1 SDR family NAD(P)-dependent oxidoreductase [Pseudomonas sp. Dout3]MEB0095164.1 SDR family NAD(P)-dependent oxidoreductase [Pseudomonas sp. DC1.2]WPX58722.1 SDR family NAD(P)-dependent oxidoreductase [Pseudomonas sp. DC1.2]